MVALLAGCMGGTPKHRTSIPPAVSLLLDTPYIGDETTVRDPTPQPTRMVIADESVEGWPSPPERVLRFPLELRQGARLSMRLGGAAASSTSDSGELIFRVEYIPETSQSIQSIPAFESTPEQGQQVFKGWVDIDVPLEIGSPGPGELRFSVEGELTGVPETGLFWGQPTVYYPRERLHRNVLLIGVDTLRQDSVTPFGGDPTLTPNLQKFSATCTMFPRNWSQCPWTLPSFASMLTGKLPSRIGATMLSWQLPDRATSVAEILLPYGYATGTVCSNTYLGNSSSGFHQGMESLWYRYNVRADTSIDRAKRFILRSKDRDWFCFLHLQDPHTPYEPPKRFAQDFGDPNYQGKYKWSFADDGDWKFSTTIPPEGDIRQVKSLYEAEVAYLDYALQNLFDFLRENDLYKDTLIIFVADHGEEFYEHGMFEHGQSHFDAETRVPLMVRGKGFPQGKRIEESTGDFDIVPTILRYVDVPTPPDIAGVPLQDIVAGTVKDNRVIYGEDNIRGTQRKFAVQWPYKCILDMTSSSRLLFDLENDPGEKRDVSSLYPEIADGLAREMVVQMLPEETTFHIWFMGSGSESPRRFTGTLRMPGGIGNMQAFGLTGDDEYRVDGDTVTFAVTNANPEVGVDKHFTLGPAGDSDTLEITLRVDGKIDPEHFFPYGTLKPEPSGFAVVHIGDFPLVADIPTGEKALQGAFYVWGVRGFGYGVERAQLDQESLDQLKALGYIQ